MESQVNTELKFSSTKPTREDIDILKVKLPTNAYAIIEERIKSKVKARTIEQMFNHRRTMRPDVWQAANEFIEFLSNKS